MFSSKSLYALEKSIQGKCKFSDSRLLAWKLTNLFISFFKPQVSFLLNFASIFFVLAQTSYTLDENSPSKWNVWIFQWLGGLKFTKFLMSYLISQVSFSLNLVSLFNVTRSNSFVFLVKTLYDFYNRSPSKCKISDFRLLRWNFTKFYLW